MTKGQAAEQAQKSEAPRETRVEHEENTRQVLYGASGVVEAAEVLAILGASGAGKSSLIDILAGRKTVGTITGTLLLNGKEVTAQQIRQVSGYVAQQDVLSDTLTVRETLEFVSDLKIPQSVCATRAERKARVQIVMEALKLEEVADTKVGGAFHRGISGGERRRVSVGMEFLTSPQILFMDEPTSGLDSASALFLFDTLKTLAEHKHMIIIATIHQPRSDIFAMFDKLMLLSEGCVAFQGPAVDVLGFFGAFGLRCTSGWNTADW
jgi:ABC-type multidrug transport system ATPase subunit